MVARATKKEHRLPQSIAQHGSRFIAPVIKKKAEKASGKSCFCEPFAGHAWATREPKPSTCLLGDTDEKTVEYLKKLKEVKHCKIVKQDWKRTINQVSRNCLLFLDPPWYRGKPRDGKYPGKYGEKDYFPEIVKICKQGRKCIIQAPPEKAKELSQEFNCELWEVEQGKKRFKYLICDNLSGKRGLARKKGKCVELRKKS